MKKILSQMVRPSSFKDNFMGGNWLLALVKAVRGSFYLLDGINHILNGRFNFCFSAF